MQKKKIKKTDYKKFRLAGDYQHECEEEQQQQTSKRLDKKELLKKPTKDDLKNLMNGVIEKKQA